MKHIDNFWRILEARKRVIEIGEGMFCLAHALPVCETCTEFVSYKEMLHILSHFADINIMLGQKEGVVFNVPSDRDYIYPIVGREVPPKASVIGRVHLVRDVPLCGQVYMERGSAPPVAKLITLPPQGGEPIVIDGNYVDERGITWGQVIAGEFIPILTYSYPNWRVYAFNETNAAVYSNGVGAAIR